MRNSCQEDLGKHSKMRQSEGKWVPQFSVKSSLNVLSVEQIHFGRQQSGDIWSIAGAHPRPRRPRGNRRNILHAQHLWYRTAQQEAENAKSLSRFISRRGSRAEIGVQSGMSDSSKWRPRSSLLFLYVATSKRAGGTTDSGQEASDGHDGLKPGGMNISNITEKDSKK